MEFGWLRCRERRAPALLGVDVQKHRMMHVLERLEKFNQMLQIVPVRRPDVDEPELFENLVRRNRGLDRLLQMVDGAERRLSDQRNLRKVLLRPPLDLL